MVYEVKCDRCGDLIDFGGHNPEEKEVAPKSKIPDDAFELDDKVFCQSCVKDLVRFGIGDVRERMEFLESELEDVKDELGMERGMND